MGQRERAHERSATRGWRGCHVDSDDDDHDARAAACRAARSSPDRLLGAQHSSGKMGGLYPSASSTLITYEPKPSPQPRR
eukprot:scaffold946_cov415-Prasinococcus_capsulatus_cf.AAC.7